MSTDFFLCTEDVGCCVRQKPAVTGCCWLPAGGCCFWALAAAAELPLRLFRYILCRSALLLFSFLVRFLPLLDYFCIGFTEFHIGNVVNFYLCLKYTILKKKKIFFASEAHFGLNTIYIDDSYIHVLLIEFYSNKVFHKIMFNMKEKHL